MNKVLEVKGLSKQYDKVLAANNVNFDIDSGEIFALIGPNGAGKTTTIRMISTLIKPTSGDAVIAGHSVIKEPEKVRECITYLPDEAGAYKTMKGISYLRFMAGRLTLISQKNTLKEHLIYASLVTVLMIKSVHTAEV